MSKDFKIMVFIFVLVSAILFPVNAIGIGQDGNGNYLIDKNGMTLYYFANDAPNTGISNCYGSCASEWPPVYEDEIDKSLKAEDFSTITRTDGSFQTTYRGRPLYKYKDDKKIGDQKGNNKYDLWFVMRE